MFIPEVNLADYLWTNTAHYLNETALVCGMTGRQYTYEVAKQMSEKFGSALKRLGAKKGDVVAFLLPNIPEFPIGSDKFYHHFLNTYFQPSLDALEQD